MKVTATVPAIQPIETFLSYLKDRSADPIHENNVDVIADFIDRFMVIEMKRLETVQDTVKTDVEIPDDLVTKPLEAANKQLDIYKAIIAKYVSTMGEMHKDLSVLLHGAGVVDITPELVRNQKLVEINAQSDEITAQEDKPRIKVSAAEVTLRAAAARARNGNGHKSLKIRDLEDGERDLIRAAFMAINGQITEDACKPIHARIDQVISIAQVTGFVSYLHGQVMGGAFKVRDMDSYMTFLQSHRDLWATYNSPKYVAMRAKNATRQ